jgi:hypothetical protein
MSMPLAGSTQIRRFSTRLTPVTFSASVPIALGCSHIEYATVQQEAVLFRDA